MRRRAVPCGCWASSPTWPPTRFSSARRRWGVSGIRLGWTPGEWRQTCHSPLNVVQKLVGLLLSAFAASMGAPIWFDLLRNLFAIRSVGKNLTEQTAARDKKAKTDEA